MENYGNTHFQQRNTTNSFSSHPTKSQHTSSNISKSSKTTRLKRGDDKAPPCVSPHTRSHRPTHPLLLSMMWKAHVRFNHEALFNMSPQVLHSLQLLRQCRSAHLLFMPLLHPSACGICDINGLHETFSVPRNTSSLRSRWVPSIR